tara:strand:+ start:8720 stop:9184 length:465 start_codon:yes stop_codon:yes gene_type:complete
MEPSEKIFVNKEPNDDDLEIIINLIQTHDIKKYIPDSYVYIQINEGEDIEVLRFPDKAVHGIIKEYKLKAKQAVQFIYHELDIEQSIKELQYWSDVNVYRKYIPVIAEAQMKRGMEKVYADFAIYAKDQKEAFLILGSMDFDEYLYLEDVDEEA